MLQARNGHNQYPFIIIDKQRHYLRIYYNLTMNNFHLLAQNYITGQNIAINIILNEQEKQILHSCLQKKNKTPYSQDQPLDIIDLLTISAEQDCDTITALIRKIINHCINNQIISHIHMIYYLSAIKQYIQQHDINSHTCRKFLHYYIPNIEIGYLFDEKDACLGIYIINVSGSIQRIYNVLSTDDIIKIEQVVNNRKKQNKDKIESIDDCYRGRHLLTIQSGVLHSRFKAPIAKTLKELVEQGHITPQECIFYIRDTLLRERGKKENRVKDNFLNMKQEYLSLIDKLSKMAEITDSNNNFYAVTAHQGMYFTPPYPVQQGGNNNYRHPAPIHPGCIPSTGIQKVRTQQISNGEKVGTIFQQQSQEVPTNMGAVYVIPPHLMQQAGGNNFYAVVTTPNFNHYGYANNVTCPTHYSFEGQTRTGYHNMHNGAPYPVQQHPDPNCPAYPQTYFNDISNTSAFPPATTVYIPSIQQFGGVYRV